MPDFGFSAASLQSSDRFSPYSKVILKTDNYDNAEVRTFTAGDNSGRTLEFVTPWASQESANSILESIRGYAYQPITAKGVIVDPATELGDDITVGGVSGYIENQDITFGGILRADIAAPGEEQIDHEYQFIVKRDRKYARDMGAIGGGIRANKEAIRQASVQLIADIGDVRAGLYAIATADDIKGFKEAKTTLFAQIQDDKQALQAGIEARVKSEDFGKYQESVVQTYATIKNVNASLRLKAETKTVEALDGRVTTIETASANLSARVTDAEAGLRLKAETSTVTALDGRVSTVETATASLSARVDGAEASLELTAKDVNGVKSSVATLSADVINLKGRVDLTGVLTVSETLNVDRGIFTNGNILCANISLHDGGQVLAHHVTLQSGGYIRIAEKVFTPQEITSTTGAVTVLGYA